MTDLPKRTIINMKQTSHLEQKGDEYLKNKVKEYRTKLGMTQQQLAQLVYVSSRTIISIEKEQYHPSLLLAYRIACVFHSTVEDLCCLKENKEMEDLQYERF